MKRIPISHLVGSAVLIALFAVVTAVPVSAQFAAEQMAAIEMNNTLQGGSTGPSMAAQQAAYNAPPAGYGQPPVNPYANPYAQYGAPGVPPVPAPAPAPAAARPKEPMIMVLTGEKVTDAVTGDLLEDIYYEVVPATRKSEFFNDGTNGDLDPNDIIWTKYTEKPNDFLSPDSDYIKQVYLRMSEISEETNPIEFFRIPIATDDPLSRLPNLSEKEADRDETFLRKWHKEFLRLYRIDSQDPNSDFFPVYVPRAPRKPEGDAPAAEQFFPNAYAMDNYIQTLIDQAVAPSFQAPQQQFNNTGSSNRIGRNNSASASGSSSSGGSRWGQLRQDARNLQGYGTNQSSGYFGR